MRLNKRGGIWFAAVWVGGKRIRRSTRCSDKRAAAAVAAGWERAAADPAGEDAATTLDHALEAILTLKREEATSGKRSADTVRFYEGKAAVLSAVLGGDELLCSLTAARLDAYVSDRRRSVADATIYKELVVLTSALKLMKRRGLWRGDIEAIKPPVSVSYQPKRRVVTPAQLDVILGWLAPDDAARAAWMVATGGELRASRNALRADLAGQIVPVHGTKRDTRERMVPVLTTWQRELLAYAEKHAQGAEGKLFREGDAEDRFRYQLRLAGRRAGVAVSANDLRRSYSTWMRAAGASLPNLARAMGHSDTRMLERVYDGTTPEQLAALLAADLGVAWVTGGSHKSTPVATSETTGANEVPDVGEKMAPRAGFEPATRGLTVPARIWSFPNKYGSVARVVKARGSLAGHGEAEAG